MLQTVKNGSDPLPGKSLAATFFRLGWIGFWMQIGIGAVPVTLMLYSLVFIRSSGAGTRAGLALIEYLTMASLLVLVFTTVWFYRYTQLARRIADPQDRPSGQAVRRTAWTGAAASTLGIGFSMLIMMLEVAQLLFYFLRAPQVGIPVVQTTGGGQASWVSAADIVSLLVLILTTCVEVAVLAISLWLLSRASGASAEYPDAGEGGHWRDEMGAQGGLFESPR